MNLYFKQIFTILNDECTFDKLLFIFGGCRYITQDMWIMMARITLCISIFKEWTRLRVHQMDDTPSFMKIGCDTLYSICNPHKMNYGSLILFSCMKDMWFSFRRRWKRVKNVTFKLNEYKLKDRYCVPTEMYIRSGSTIIGRLHKIYRHLDDMLASRYCQNDQSSGDMYTSRYSQRGIVVKAPVSKDSRERYRLSELT